MLVALSGGPDSLALAAAAVFEAKRLEVEAGAIIIDHDLQEGSAKIAEHAAEQAAELGLAPVSVVRVNVEDLGAGPEASARVARYEAIEAVRVETGASWVLLGHTLDDQAETVLLGLARGSGAKSLHGMAPVTGTLLRPLLGLHRQVTVQACEDQGITPWIDPHNSDPAYTRVRVRDTVLPLLEKELGPGISEALARTADQLQDDSEVLETLARARFRELYDDETGFVVWGLEPLEPALRDRVLRLAALRAGCPPSELTVVHVKALLAQVLNERNLPKQVQLPGHVTAIREGDVLRFVRAPLA